MTSAPTQRADMIVHEQEPYNAEPPRAALAEHLIAPQRAQRQAGRVDRRPGPPLGQLLPAGRPPAAARRHRHRTRPGDGVAPGAVALDSERLAPDDGDELPAGPTRVTGCAFAGDDRTVIRVDVSAVPTTTGSASIRSSVASVGPGAR